MSQIPVFPDELVHLVCEMIAYNRGEITLPELWKNSGSFIGLSDDSLKEFVFSCVCSHPDVMLYERGNLSDKVYSEVAGNEDIYKLSISEDTLWTILTGYGKKEANIGGSAFELLLEIAKAGEKGINTKDLALATNQDPRSITGRVKKIGHLICSVQMIYKGHVVRLLKLKKYAESDNAVKPYVNMRDYFGQIVEIVRKSKNGVRQIIDLKRELKFDVEKRLSKAFIAAIAWLNEKEYLKKVLLVSPTNPSVRIRCVKYLRDYVQEDKTTNDFDYESETGGDDPLDDDKFGLEEEDAYEGLDSTNATNALQEGCLLVQDERSPRDDSILMNRFYPIQNQTYDMTEKAGLQGISTMEVIKKLTGKDYKRAFTKSSEYYVESIGKTKNNVNEYSIVRVYDFEGKKKFYRFFTDENFRKLTDAPQRHVADGFEPMESQRESLGVLNDSNFIPLSSSLRFGDNNGEQSFFWNGEIKSPASGSGRGRKRKQEDVAAMQRAISSSKKRRTFRQRDEFPSISDSAGTLDRITNLSSNHNENEGINKTRVLEIGGFSASSLRSLWRQRAILEVIKKAGGVTYLKEQFFEDISHFMGSNTLLDKKTVKGDVDLMLQNKKLGMEEESRTRKRIIYLPDVDPNAISNYILQHKDSKKAYFKDVIHNTDIYFFDQTEKDRFHRGVKSAERVRNYQDRSRIKKQQAQQNAWKKKAEDALSLQKQYKLSRNLTVIDENGSSKKNKKVKKGKGKPLFQVGNKRGAKALIMSVVIMKSIKNEILWDEIIKLFPSNSLKNLKKQWTSRRIKMGHAGWKAYVDKWRKILVSATREERVMLEDVERLDLPKLINLWITSDVDEDQKPILLYKDYLENRKRYTLMRVGNNGGMRSGLAMSSMVQRETSSLKKIFVYDNCHTISKPLPSWGTEDDVKAVIRSILYDNPDTSKEKIDILSTIPKELVDKVIMDMAKEKHLYLRGSKLESTNTLREFLEAKGNYKTFEQVEMYRNKLEEMFQAGNGVIISEEISDIASWLFIDLITQLKVNLDVIPAIDSGQKLNYITRRLGIRGLTPPLIVSPKKSTRPTKEVRVPVPMGEPNSRLWIDGSGCLRGDVWKRLLSMIVNEILFNPGITLATLEQNYSLVLSRRELKDICDWLLRKSLVHGTSFEGLQVDHEWYTLLK